MAERTGQHRECRGPQATKTPFFEGFSMPETIERTSIHLVIDQLDFANKMIENVETTVQRKHK